MEGEPPFGSFDIHMTPAERRILREKIIKGGKIADQIRAMAKKHHEEHEGPQAEESIETGLKNMEKEVSHSKNQSPQVEKKHQKEGWWKRFFQALKRLLIP